MKETQSNIVLLIVDDLHLEGRPKDMCLEFANSIKEKIESVKNNNGTPILVCAGDISEGVKGIEWVKQFECSIIYVCGNHEFWHGDYYEVIKSIKNLTLKKGYEHISFLHNETVILNNIKFIGATLWTELGASWAWAKKNYIVSHYASMSDFKQITARKFYRNGDEVTEMCHFMLENGIDKGEITDLIANEMFNPYLQVKENNKSLDFIENELLSEHDGPVVVVSHHLPVSDFWMQKFGMKDAVMLAPYINNRSIYQEYQKKKIPPEKDVLMMGFYINNFNHLFNNHISPDIWVHGHFHKSVDGFLGDTHIVSSPAGYVRQSSKISIKEVCLNDRVKDYCLYATNEIETRDWEEKVFSTLDELALLIANISEPIINGELSPEVMGPILSTYRKNHEKNLKELEQFSSRLLLNLVKIEKDKISIDDQLYITSYMSGFAKWASKNGRVGIDPLGVVLTESSFVAKHKFVKGAEKFRQEHYIGWIEEIERIKSQAVSFKQTLLDFFKIKQTEAE